MEQLRKAFEAQVGKPLVTVIEKETSGWFEYGLRGLVLGPLGFDVWLLHRACHGAGTHENLLTEVLAGRTNEDIVALKAEYHRTYHHELDHVIRGELSMKTERMFNMILAVYLYGNYLIKANRPPEYAPIDPRQIEDDIRALYNAGEGRAGTDEITFCGIILNRSDAQLRQIAAGYKHHHRHSLLHAIHSEFSGHMREVLIQALEGALDPMARDATLIEQAMEGAGTKDERLTYRIIRAHWRGRQYLAGVEGAYQSKYHKSIIRRVKGETSGDYERLLIAVLEG
jgi:annexin A7/11